ncbi:hypothetical protein SDC9_103385 [bioreactor metagenome]|uniref:Uncharacterized protein n=1 Tax=bioreactor metagenome TaxID=1076179 RepID=A0A645AUN2_9ZZZZ
MVWMLAVTLHPVFGRPGAADERLPVTGILVAVDDPGQVEVRAEARILREDQPALALVGHFPTRPVTAEIERNPGLAGDIGALIGRWSGRVHGLLARHADAQLGEGGAASRNAGNFAVPFTFPLDHRALAGLDLTDVGHRLVGGNVVGAVHQPAAVRGGCGRCRGRGGRRGRLGRLAVDRLFGSLVLGVLGALGLVRLFLGLGVFRRTFGLGRRRGGGLLLRCCCGCRRRGGFFGLGLVALAAGNQCAGGEDEREGGFVHRGRPMTLGKA